MDEKTARLREFHKAVDLAKSERIESLERRNTELQIKLANALQVVECQSYMRAQAEAELDMARMELELFLSPDTQLAHSRGVH